MLTIRLGQLTLAIGLLSLVAQRLGLGINPLLTITLLAGGPIIVLATSFTQQTSSTFDRLAITIISYYSIYILAFGLIMLRVPIQPLANYLAVQFLFLVIIIVLLLRLDTGEEDINSALGYAVVLPLVLDIMVATIMTTLIRGYQIIDALEAIYLVVRLLSTVAWIYLGQILPRYYNKVDSYTIDDTSDTILYPNQKS